MKLTIIISMLLICSISFSQETVDEIIRSYVVGSWEHVKSTYPDKHEETYHQTLIFNADSSLICLKIYGADTGILNGMWYIKDTCLYINTIIFDTTYILSEVSFVDFITYEKLFTTTIWGPESQRKSAYYIRKRERE